MEINICVILKTVGHDCTYEMSNVRYVNIIKVALLMGQVINFFEVANDFKSVCRQQPQCVSDGCLTVMALR